MKTREILKVVPLVTLALLMSCSGEKKDSAAETHDEKVKVKIEQVSAQDVDQIAEFTATVEANIKNNIAPPVAGTYRKAVCRSRRPCERGSGTRQDG